MQNLINDLLLQIKSNYFNYVFIILTKLCGSIDILLMGVGNRGARGAEAPPVFCLLNCQRTGEHEKSGQ